MGDPKDYVVLEVPPTSDMALFQLTGFIDPTTGYTNEYVLKGIEPVTVPPTAILKMNADRNFPHGDWVTPILRAREWVVNDRIKSLFESLGTDLEFLPVPVVDKKGKPLSEPYCFFRPLKEFDCIDKEKSEITWDENNAKYIDKLTKLVISDDKLPEKSAFFRITPSSTHR